jgi:NDP-sugar pyrophosphorylase family protein
VGPGAIVVVGSDRQPFSVTPKQTREDEVFFSKPFTCVDVLGRSVVERTIDRLVRADTELVSVLIAAEIAGSVQSLTGTWSNVRFQAVPDFSLAIQAKLQEHSEAGIEHSFVVSANVYAETDLLDLFYFHREAGQVVTRSFDREGPMELWVVSCAQAQDGDLSMMLGNNNGSTSSYFVREYVRRVAGPKEIRQFATDVLQNRCAARPSGREVKPGIWMDEGAEAHRRARIVAPAYIGRRSKVQQDALVTRCSNIEEDCCIDCGTVIENSSVLCNTHVGIWLDVCYAMAEGNLFLSLNHDVALEISDPAIIRVNGAFKKTKSMNRGLMQWDDAKAIVPDVQQVVALQPLDSKLEKPPAPESWQLGANPIQG